MECALISDVDVGVVDDVVAAPQELGVDVGVFPTEVGGWVASALVCRNPQRMVVDQQNGVRAERARAMPLYGEKCFLISASKFNPLLSFFTYPRVLYLPAISCIFFYVHEGISTFVSTADQSWLKYSWD
jgi:hypothetical protein